MITPSANFRSLPALGGGALRHRSPSANFTHLFRPSVSALTPSSACNMIFAEGEIKNVQ
jgi:hypothetical protein